MQWNKLSLINLDSMEYAVKEPPLGRFFDAWNRHSEKASYFESVARCLSSPDVRLIAFRLSVLHGKRCAIMMDSLIVLYMKT